MKNEKSLMTPANITSRHLTQQPAIGAFERLYAAAPSWVRADPTLVLVVGVVVLGAGARFYGLEWGLPYHFHTDERFMVVTAEKLRTADSIAKLADQPYFFLYPPFLYYLLIALVNLVSIFYPFSPADPEGGTLYYLLARGITACFGSATLVLVYILGKRLYSKSAGLLAAVFLAFSVLHVRDSHFYTADVAFTFFVLLVVLCAAAIAEKGRAQSYVLGGIVAGVGMATKQTTLMVFPVIAAAHALAMFKEQTLSWNTTKRIGLSLRFWQLLLLPMGVAGLTYLLLDPFVLVNPRRFFQMNEILAQFVGGTGQHYWSFQFTGTTIAYWFGNLLYFGMGPLLELIGIGGLVWALTKRGTADILILAFLLPYFFFVGVGYMKFIRYAVPLLPFFTLLGARLLVDLWENANQKIARVAAGGLTGVVIVTTGLYALAYLNIYRQKDVRIQAAEWIHREIPRGSAILIDSSAATPLIGSRFFQPEFYGRTVVENDMYATRNDYFKVKILNLLTNPPRPPHPPAWWENYLAERLTDVDYIIMSDEHYEQYSHRPETYPVVVKFHRDLLSGRSEYRLIKSFKTYPSLFGYSVNDDRAELTWRLFDHPRIWIFKRGGPTSR